MSEAEGRVNLDPQKRERQLPGAQSKTGEKLVRTSSTELTAIERELRREGASDGAIRLFLKLRYVAADLDRPFWRSMAYWQGTVTRSESAVRRWLQWLRAHGWIDYCADTVEDTAMNIANCYVVLRGAAGSMEAAGREFVAGLAVKVAALARRAAGVREARRARAFFEGQVAGRAEVWREVGGVMGGAHNPIPYLRGATVSAGSALTPEDEAEVWRRLKAGDEFRER